MINDVSSSNPSISTSVSTRLLVVDDQRDVVSALRDYFEPKGYTVHSAFDGEDALKMVLTTPLDVMVLDLLMPKMDGLELCRRLKENPETADMSILVLTAVDRLDPRLNALRSGADDYLTKPFSFQELELRVTLQARMALQRRETRALLQGEQRKTGNLEMVAEMARHITSLAHGDLHTVCDATAQSLVDRFEYEYVSIHLVDRELSETVLYAKAGTFTNAQSIGHRSSIDYGIVGLVCRTGSPYLTNDVLNDPYFEVNPGDPDKWTQIRSEICMPIQTGDQPIGCVNIESTRIDAFEPSDQLMLEALAGHLAIALTNVRLYRESVERNMELAVQGEILAALNATRDVQTLFQSISAQIKRLIPLTTLGISRYEKEKETITVLYIDHPDDVFHAGAMFPANAMPYTIEVCRRGEPLYAGDLSTNSKVGPEVQDRLRKMGGRSALFVPIQHQEKVISVMTLFHNQAEAYTDRDVERVRQIIPHIALAIIQAEEYEALQRAHADLKQAQNSIIQSEREKASLDTALQTGLTLSHEINNPLTAVIGFAELLAREYPDRSEYRIILDAGQRIADVVRRLRQLKEVRSKAYVTDIPIRMLDLDADTASSSDDDTP